MELNSSLNKKILIKILEADPKTYIIFYREHCPYCDMARSALRKSKFAYKGYDISNVGGLVPLLKLFNEHSNEIGFDIRHYTVPIIFYNRKFIGGSEELIKHLQSRNAVGGRYRD